MKQLRSLWFFIFILIASLGATNASANVVGGIDGFQPGTTILTGWTCRDDGVNSAPWVEIYMDAPRPPAGANAFFRAQSTTPSNAHCSSGGGIWQIDMQTFASDNRQYWGYVSQSNATLANSGNRFVGHGPVLGNIDGVFQLPNGNFAIQGWACQKYELYPISVDLYVGGGAGSWGTGLIRVAANLTNESAVNTACGLPPGNVIARRFSIDLTPWRSAWGGQPLFVYGISVANGTNPALTNSGVFKMPLPQVTPPSCSLSGSAATVPKGQNFTFVLGSANLPVNTTAFWMGTTDSVAIAPLAVGANSGSFSFINSSPASHMRYTQFKNGSGQVVCETNKIYVTFMP